LVLSNLTFDKGGALSALLASPWAPVSASQVIGM
jgi:hypothetical protein